MEITLAKFFGTPDGVKVGALFVDRREVHESGAHRPLQGGISGTRAEGADSIVVSGGYTDDQDHGDYIIYTGHGGKDPNSNKQTSDQSANAPGNAGLITSMVQGLPVRVIRGAHKGSPFAPPSGYQYAGLFTVQDYWIKAGKQGFQIIQFRLDRIPEQTKLWTGAEPELDPAYATSTITRRVRDTQLSRYVKNIYSNHCQICQTAVPGVGERSYAEGAHVKPLGRPHLGDDSLSNLLCLCPNHHAQLDIGGMIITDDFVATSLDGKRAVGSLTFLDGHRLDTENVRYHRQHWKTGLLT